MKRFTALVLIGAATLSGCETGKSEPIAAPFSVADCPAETRRTAPELDLAKSETDLLEPSGPGLWIGGAPFSPGFIDDAHQSFAAYNNEPVVDIRFSAAGQNRFLCIQQGRVGKQIEMSYDGKLLSRPILNEMITGNQVQIGGNLTVEAAQKLAAKIKQRRP